MNQIVVNGNRYSVSGKNITVKNGTVYVDDKIIESNLSGEVTIKFEGDLANLDCNNAIVNGYISGNVDCNSLKCGNISGNVDATSVICCDISGDVYATSVNCKNNFGKINL